MTMRSWIRHLFTRPATRTIRKATRRTRLSLEALEDRWVPSTFTVLNGDDDGAGSLRAALAAANDETSNPGHDTINFAAGVTAVTLTTDLLTISSDVSITGPAAKVMIARDATAPEFRIFEVAAGASAELSGLTITGGNANRGGGVLNQGTATLTNCTVSDNSALLPGGGFGFGGGVFNESRLILNHCTLTRNSAGEGGGAFNAHILMLTNCTISGNESVRGGGVFNGGTATLTNCTVSGNVASGDGGGLDNGGALTLTNSIVANSTGADVVDLGTILGSHNLIEDASGGLADSLTGDPLLGPLANNGGATQTLALLDGSPAIDAGTSGPGIPTTDQRGVARVGAVDIGAYENTTIWPIELTTALESVNEGDTAALVNVATFTHGNGTNPASAYTAAIDWGIPGHSADPAAVAQHSDGSYSVTALRPVFADNGVYPVAVSVSQVGNPATLVTATVPAQGRMNSITVGGTGSPQGSFATSFSNNRQSATLIYDQFVASAGPGVPAVAARKNSQTNINLAVPDGVSSLPITFDYRGYVGIPAGMTAVRSAVYFFNGEPFDLPETTFTGPDFRDYLRRETLVLPIAPELAGAVVPLNIQVTVRLLGAPGLAAQMTQDSMDILLPAGFAVRNVAPTLSDLTNNSPECGGAFMGRDAVRIAADFTDPGILDTHTVSIDWGDGTTTAGSVDDESHRIGGRHVYQTGGVFTITVTLTDDDGGSSVQTTTATVGGVGLQDGVLQIIGTQGHDDIHVSQQGSTIRVWSRFDVEGSGWDDWDGSGGWDSGNDDDDHDSRPQRFTFEAADVTSIRIVGCAGDDRISVGPQVDALVNIDGGAGDNRVWVRSDNDNNHRRSNLVTVGDGANRIWTEGGSVRIKAGDGDNEIHLGGDNDKVEAGDGDNRIWGGRGSDTITLGGGTNRIDAGDGDDLITIDGGGGHHGGYRAEDGNQIKGGGGNDLIRITGRSNDEIDAGAGDDLVYAGGGNDVLDGGHGNDALLGGDSADVLSGGEGRDLLIGGRGSDRLVGNASDDILIAGYTAYDEDEVSAAMRALMAIWTSGQSYATRVAAITENRPFAYRLIADGPNQTVFSDGAVDQLTGSSGADLFFANTFADAGDDAVKDVLTDLAKTGETALDVDTN